MCYKMKRFLFLLVFGILLGSCSPNNPNVLLFVRDGSIGLEYMLTHEVNAMKDLLEKAGMKVSVATLSGAVIEADSTSLIPDVQLSEVNVMDYKGFIIPCMASDSIHPDMVDFVKEVVEAEKPIAAQLGSVMILAEAGVLDGKKYAYSEEEEFSYEDYPVLSDAIYSGRGVVQDGMILTSGTCPWMEKEFNRPDGTIELTEKFIALIESR